MIITSPPSISTDFRNGSTAAIEYTYDTNGNLTKDLNKNISLIKYNTLNLPSVITFADGVTVTYLYDAVGSKLSVAYNSGGTTAKTEYAGNKVYKNGTLSMLLTEGGYATLSGTTPTYYYYLSDHQGNNRVVLSQSGTVEQVNNYYPFGGAFGEGVQNSNQPYKYNGKELDRTFELNLYDYGARHYDAAIGRWGTMDPMAEKYYSISPYAYVANNPVNNIDLRGDSITTVVTSIVNASAVNTTYYYGQDANGNFGFIDSNGQIYSGGDQFVTSLTTALGDLRSGVKGNALVEDLMNSTKTVQIANYSGNKADPNGKYVLWNPASTNGGPDQTGSTTRPAYIGLGHEMGHIQDVWNKTYDASTWTKITDAQGNTINIPNAEKYSTHVENQLRSEHGISLRTHYSHGVNSTRILQPGTNQSLFYKRTVTIRGITVPTTPYIY